MQSRFSLTFAFSHLTTPPLTKGFLSHNDIEKAIPIYVLGAFTFRIWADIERWECLLAQAEKPTQCERWQWNNLRAARDCECIGEMWYHWTTWNQCTCNPSQRTPMISEPHVFFRWNSLALMQMSSSHWMTRFNSYKLSWQKKRAVFLRGGVAFVPMFLCLALWVS